MSKHSTPFERTGIVRGQRIRSHNPVEGRSIPATTVVLHCGHVVKFRVSSAPKRGEQIYCVKCEAMQGVSHVHGAWSFQCQSCGYSRHFGKEPNASRTAAEKHARQKHHKVLLVQWGSDEPILIDHTNDPQLDYDRDDPNVIIP